MKTEALIKKLASEAAPVTPVSPPLLLAGRWLALSLLFLVPGVLLLGPRRDLGEEIRSGIFWLQLSLPLGLGLAAALAACAFGIPDRSRKWPFFVPVLVQSMGALGFAYLIHEAHEHQVGAGLNCLRNIFLLSLAPAALFYHSLKRTAPLQPRWQSMWGLVATASLSAASTRLICPNESSLHFLVWHFLPPVLLGAMVYALLAAYARLRRERHSP